MIHLEFLCVMGRKYWGSFFWHIIDSLYQYHLIEKLILPPLYCCGIFVESLLALFWAFYSVSLISYLCLLPVQHCLDYYSFISLPTFSFSKSFYFFCRFLEFSYKFRNLLLIFTRKPAEILIRIILNLLVNLNL